MIILKTNHGDITVKLDFANTPISAQNFLDYAKSGFFNGTIFHRVIRDFMVQGGGFEPGMTQKSTNPSIENEANKGGANVRGSLAMARTMEPHSASSQFFINVKDNDFLNHKSPDPQGWGYCVFGHVVDGMDIVDAIVNVPTTSRQGHDDVPVDDVVIESVVIEETV